MTRIFLTVILVVGFGSYSFSADSKAKARTFYNLYPKSDIDGDKKVSRSEMEQFLLKKVNSKDTSANSKLMKKFLDNAPGADGGDGVMTKVEMIKYVRNFRD